MKRKTNKLNFLNRTVNRLNKLEPQEFLGICKILGVEIYKENEEPKTGEELVLEVFAKLENLGKVQRRNLEKLLKAATKDR